jgi:hypothetical protein
MPPTLSSVSFVLLPKMSTWLEQKPIKNRWQPLPHQIALSLIGTLARGTQKNNHFPVSKNGISTASSVCLEQGNLLSQRAPFYLFWQHSPQHERSVKKKT